MRKKRVLILGIGQSNFLDALYGDIKKKSDNFDLTISNYSIFNDKIKEEEVCIYDSFIDLKAEKSKLSKFKLLLYLFQFTTTIFFWEVLFFELSQKSTFKGIKKKIISLVRTKYIVDNFINNKCYDWLHIHFCTPANVEWLYFISQSQKSIVSFWGSDLLRLTGVSNVFYVGRALKKCTQITVQTVEMRENICVKYGRYLFDKIKDLRFTINTEIFESIDFLKNNSDVLLKFKTKIKVPFNRIIVALGHNGFQENNHIKMIKSLQCLSKEMKNRIVFTIHLGYGASEEYKVQLKEVLDNQSDLTFCVIDCMLDHKDIAKLRLITNIMVQAPVSDALSGAMTEVLYAGNQVIAGAWLPYGILRRKGVVFNEIECFSELPIKLGQCVLNLDCDLSSNNNAIKTFLFPNETTSKWISLYKN